MTSTHLIDVQAGQGPDSVRIVHISDTHSRHRELTHVLPSADILIHSGDIIDRHASAEERARCFRDFNVWLGDVASEFPVRIVVLGNHDIVCKGMSADEIAAALSNATAYLQDTSVVLEDLGGLTVWGSPWTSASPSHMFGLRSREERAAKYATCPPGTDIVVTHMPPQGILDLAWKNTPKDAPYACAVCDGALHPPSTKHWGDPALLAHLRDVVRPSLHVFGHVHDETGTTERHGITFVNSAFDLDRCVHVIELSYTAAEGGGAAYPLDRAHAFEWVPSVVDGWSFIRHVASRRVVDVDRGATEEGTPVILWKRRSKSNPRANQLWRLGSNGTIVSALDPELGLAVTSRDPHTVVLRRLTPLRSSRKRWSLAANGALSLSSTGATAISRVSDSDASYTLLALAPPSSPCPSPSAAV